MSSSTIVVIGGGVIGLSASYHLARRNAGRVILLEKGKLGDGSSSRAAGIGTHLMWTEAGIRARQIGFQLFREFSADWDDFTFHDEKGCLNLFDKDAWPTRAAILPMYDRLDVAHEVLNAQDVRDRWPCLTPPDNLIALYDPRGGYSEPAEYIPALTKRVRELGVEIVEHAPVLEFVTRGGRVAGVRTPERTVEADAVISSVHVWSLPLWNELGVRFPIKHFVHQRYISTPLASELVMPPVNADPYLGYLRPTSRNRVLMGVETPSREEVRVSAIDFEMSDVATSDCIRDDGRSRLSNLAPDLRELEWESRHIGLISFSSDGEPILGPIGQLPGLFLAASFHSGGYSYNTVAGLLLAELVIDGRTSIDVSSFSPDRFGRSETDFHLAETITQSQAIRRRH